MTVNAGSGGDHRGRATRRCARYGRSTCPPPDPAPARAPRPARAILALAGLARVASPRWPPPWRGRGGGHAGSGPGRRGPAHVARVGRAPAPGPSGAAPQLLRCRPARGPRGRRTGRRRRSQSVVVGNARTGRQLATLKPPPGQHLDGGDRGRRRPHVRPRRNAGPEPGGRPATSRTRWYLLRIFPGAAQPARLTAVPIPGPVRGCGHPRTCPVSRRAHARRHVHPEHHRRGHPGPTTLRTYSVVTGKLLRSWRGAESDGLVVL